MASFDVVALILLVFHSAVAVAVVAGQAGHACVTVDVMAGLTPQQRQGYVIGLVLGHHVVTSLLVCVFQLMV